MGALSLEPAVIDPVAKAHIQHQLGFCLEKADPAAVAFVVDRSREAGNRAFKNKLYAEAIKLYTQAIAGAEQDAALFANRSAAYCALDERDLAERDAHKALELRPDWPKAYFRLGAALAGKQEWRQALQAFEAGLELAPSNKDLADKAAHARKEAEYEAQCRSSQLKLERRGLIAQMRQARRAELQAAMEHQFKHGMAGPDWELADYDWRPTYFPRSRLQPLSQTSMCSPSQQAVTSFLGSYVNALADLAAPKAALAVLHDDVRLEAYAAAMREAAQELPSAHMLVLSQGTGVLPMLAVQAGASTVTAVERGRALYRMAKQTLAANSNLTSRIRLVDRPLSHCAVSGEQLPPAVSGSHLAASGSRQQEATSAPVSHHTLGDVREQKPSSSRQAPGSSSDKHKELDQPRGQDLDAAGSEQAQSDQGDDSASHAAPDLAESSTVTHESAGVPVSPAKGESASVDEPGAAADGELQAAAAWLHERADVLVTDLVDASVLGMKLLEAVDEAGARLCKPAAKMVPDSLQVVGMLLEVKLPARVCGFDLASVDAYRWHPSTEHVHLSSMPHRQLSQPFRVLRLDLQRRLDEASVPGLKEASSGLGEWELDETLRVGIDAPGSCNAVAFWFEVATHSGCTITSWKPGAAAGEATAGPERGLQEAASWRQGLQYFDSVPVAQGGTFPLRVRQSSHDIVFTPMGTPAGRARFAYAPRWHYDMIQDSPRNDAYNEAIIRAIELRRAMSHEAVHVLDMGAGSGLLSLMAARAGADHVTGAELSQHMCDVAAETVIMNNCAHKCLMVNKDVRRMDMEKKPDGSPPDLPRKANLCIFEVFDSGLIGEGVLHLLAWAQQRLLTPDATLVPMGATVFCQPLQMQFGTVQNCDVSSVNRWQWRPDYEGLHLADCRERWQALGPAMQCLAFDFYQAGDDMQPQEAALQLPIHTNGCCNALAFWFELHLDEAFTLSTSPYADKGPTWQQAVQWLPETPVRSRGQLHVAACHDTYGISFRLTQPDDAAAPPMDAMWQAAHEQAIAASGKIAKACVQSPLEFRKTALAAVALAARPADWGADAQQAAEFCCRMMS